MSNQINHRRKNRSKVAKRHDYYDNGYAVDIGESGYLDKSGHSWGDYAKLSNKHIGAGIGYDFSNGHRGMAKAVRGAKKYVRSRVRFHENVATRQLADTM